MWLVSLMGDSSVDLGPALTQIGIGALIAVPAYYMAWKFWQLISTLRNELAAVNQERLDDQKAAASERIAAQEIWAAARMQDQKDVASDALALTNRMAPMLENAVTTLRLIRDSKS